MAAQPLTRRRIQRRLAAALWLLAAGRGSAAEDPSSHAPRLLWSAGSGQAEGEFRIEGLPAAALARLPQPLDATTGEALLRVTSRPLDTSSPPQRLPQLWGTWLVDGDA
jgi:hypothetical protein